MKKVIILLAAVMFAVLGCCGSKKAAETAAFSDLLTIDELTIINVGDGRLLFRLQADATPISGARRIVDGRQSEYTLAHFRNGMYNGNYERHSRNVLVEKGAFKDGVRHGVFYDYYSDGKIKSERPFTDGKLDGTVKTYFSDGSAESQKEYKNGVEDGIERRWEWRTGELTVDAFYVAGQPHGRQSRRISSNLGNYVEVNNYVNGVKSGEFSQTWTNGQPRARGTYTNGVNNGVWVEYGIDGIPERSVTYANGERNGELTTFYANGAVETVTNYVNGQRQGVSKEFYHDTGNLKAEYNYSNNFRDGAYRTYFDDGVNVREEGRFEAGVEVYRKEYYRNGNTREIRERRSTGPWETIESFDEDGTQR